MYLQYLHFVIILLCSTINVTNLTIPSFVSWFKILSQYGTSIIFLLSFGRVKQYPSMFHDEWKYPKMIHVLHLNSITLCKSSILSSMWRTLQYPHLFESICLAWYSEYGISILEKNLLFHGLWFYCKMTWVLFSF
jgi:hypothetical protein